MYERFADLVTVSRVELEPDEFEPEIEVGEVAEPEALGPEVVALESAPEDEAIFLESEIEVAEEEKQVFAVEPEEPPVKAAPMRRPEPPPLVKVERIRDVSWGRLLFVGLVSALLGAVLALVALFLMNGTLDLQASANRALRAEAQRLDGELQALDERLSAMQDLAPVVEQARTDIQGLGQDLSAAKAQLASMSEDLSGVQSSLATLGNDVAGLEEGFGAMGKELGVLQAQTVDLQGQIATVEENLAVLQESADRFDAFLAGLRVLLSDVEAPVHSTLTPFPTPTAWITPTPEPNVTVIPLATPTAKP